MRAQEDSVIHVGRAAHSMWMTDFSDLSTWMTEFFGTRMFSPASHLVIVTAYTVKWGMFKHSLFQELD
jgi:hypothetical protein